MLKEFTGSTVALPSRTTHVGVPPFSEVPVSENVVVPEEVVLSDIDQQVAAGATHITFGDPDFLNGPGHSLRIVRSMKKDLKAAKRADDDKTAKPAVSAPTAA